MTQGWQAPKPELLPDFIICGAMKTGTTTLHDMLNKHPGVFIPEREVHFFDLDNPLQHPDFNQVIAGQWQHRKLEQAPKDYWSWYQAQFAGATSLQVVGEDSTTYLASALAAKRIGMQDKAIKLIVMLRHPTKRAVSNYWHLVRSGRATYSFADTLCFNPYSVLNRSLYSTQINDLLNHIPAEQIKFVIFEDFIANKARVLNDICDFIGVDASQLPDDVLNVHANATYYPRFVSLQLWFNRLLPGAAQLQYHQRFSLADKQSQHWTVLRVLKGIHRRINPMVKRKPAAIGEITSANLDNYFIEQLADLNELVGRDVMSLWFGDAASK